MGAIEPLIHGAARVQATSQPVLAVQGVSKTFTGGTVALQATDLSVLENDFITILGPSGCGKSTLLRMVAGLDTPTSGSIRLDGHPVAGSLTSPLPAASPYLSSSLPSCTCSVPRNSHPQGFRHRKRQRASPHVARSPSIRPSARMGR